MSTAKFDTLQNAAGSVSVPVNTVVNGSAKAWVNFNGTGTVAIRAAFNVSSITDNGVGDYTVNFATALLDGNYSASVICTGGNNINFGAARFVNAPIASSFRYVDSSTANGVAQDEAFQFVSVFR